MRLFNPRHLNGCSGLVDHDGVRVGFEDGGDERVRRAGKSVECMEQR